VDLISEEEQWERLKAWLRANGPAVLVITALLLLGWQGWKWWQSRADAQGEADAAVYEKIIGSFDANKQAEGLALIETLRREHPESPYVSGADLVAARVFVDSNQLDKAVERLKRVAETAADEKLRPIARLRLARVQSSQGQYDAALATLGTANLGVHEAARLEARGDVLLAKGDSAAALAEYTAARKLLPAQDAGGVAELLDLKIADLGGSPAAATAGVPAP
jgi:predicted negative regulator of RcsB-dependent stress response